ncbi:MAG: hypothetical protein R3C53_09295 [Pirellulaceae bacterium]
MAMLNGLQAGLHLVAAGFAMFLLGCATIWLGMRDFTSVLRNLTVAWGCCLTVFFTWASLDAYDPSNLGEAIFFGSLLVSVMPIPILAIRQSALRNDDSDTTTNGEPSEQDRARITADARHVT